MWGGLGLVFFGLVLFLAEPKEGGLVFAAGNQSESGFLGREEAPLHWKSVAKRCGFSGLKKGKKKRGWLGLVYQPLLLLDLCAEDMCLSYSSLVLKVLLSWSQMNSPSSFMRGSMFGRAVRDKPIHLHLGIEEKRVGKTNKNM